MSEARLWTCIFMDTSQILFLCLFRALPVAYGGSQSRGRIGAAIAGLHHSHSNTGSKLCLLPTPKLRQCQILNPLSKDRGRTRSLRLLVWLFPLRHNSNSTRQILNRLSHNGNSEHFFLIKDFILFYFIYFDHGISGAKPISQQQRKPQPWQCWILFLLSHQATPNATCFKIPNAGLWKVILKMKLLERSLTLLLGELLLICH